MASTIRIQTSNIVLRKITDSNARPLHNLKAVMSDIDMREWQSLSEGLTDREGKYELQWKHDQLSGRGKKQADIAVKVYFKEKDKELYSSSKG